MRDEKIFMLENILASIYYEKKSLRGGDENEDR